MTRLVTVEEKQPACQSPVSQSVLPTASPGTAGDSKIARPWVPGNVRRTHRGSSAGRCPEGSDKESSSSSFPLVSSRLHRCSSVSPSSSSSPSRSLSIALSSASCTESCALAEEAITVFVVFFFFFFLLFSLTGFER